MVRGLLRGFRAFAAELQKPESFVKGEEFEAYVQEKIFPHDKYSLAYKTPSYLENRRDYIAYYRKPDYKFRCRDTGDVFHVEAKYRRGAWGIEGGEWRWPEQLECYKVLDRKEPVFLCLGVGRKPSKPRELFLIPMNKIDAISFCDPFLVQYTYSPGSPAPSSYLMWLRRKQIRGAGIEE